MSRRLFALALLLLAPATAARGQVSAAEYAQRRDSLAAHLADGVIVALGAPEPKEDYLSFNQAPSFMYLTGYAEPDAALVIVKRAGQVQGTLFVEPREPAREVWTGRRFGTEGATRRTGLPARTIDQLRPVLDSLAATGLPFHVVGEFPERGALQADGGTLSADQQLLRAIVERHAGLRVVGVDTLVARLRGHKSAAELDLIRKAVDVTVAAERDAMRAIEPGMNEFEIQALIEYTFRRNGADRPSFATIVGSGPNSTTLHYNADDRFMKAGEVVVMDIGASYRGYAADVTRTVPVNGTFTPEQRAIYQVVRAAQAAAERQAKVGAEARLMEDTATATLARGLARLGLIESADALYDCAGSGGQRTQCPQIRLYYMHGLGHGIGLEVHDPDQFYFTGVIAPGSAFTIEPGIYVRADVLDHLPDTPRNRALVAKLRPAVQHYADIGIRIEDDYVATERGVEWISRAPREIAEVEALMKTPFTGPSPRNPAVVDWYRKTESNP
jgi:Xaa-Pro aminopeptidase